MLDYKDIGARIQAVRTAQHMSQEKLGEMVGVGTSHISHIETGKTVPSLQVFIDIINALSCSADELLCIEIEKARPIYDNWITEQLADCSQDALPWLQPHILPCHSVMSAARSISGYI